MQQMTVSLILGVAGIAGTLGSGVTTQLIARRSAYRQWVLDQRQKEFRELLSALTKSFATICRLIQPFRPMTPEEQRELEEARNVALTTIKDRIYIAVDVKRLEIYEIWTIASQEFADDYVYIPFAEKYALINAKLVDAALKHP